MKKLKLKNSDIDLFIKSLTLNLSFERSKARNEFIRSLTPAFESMEKERTALSLKYCNKNDKGEPEILNNQYQFTNENLALVTKDYNDLQEKDFVVEINEHVEKNLKVIKDIIENSDTKYSMQDSIVLERIVDAIDNIK
jgi:hypothetical protein